MNTTKNAEYATMGGFGLALIVALYEMWPSITSTGWLLSKLVFLFVCVGIIFGLLVVYRSLRGVKPPHGTARIEGKSKISTLARIAILLTIICIVGVASFVIYRAMLPSAPGVPIVLFPVSSAQLTQVRNKKFWNTTVALDGLEFINCEFTNVTFMYDGTAPVNFINNKIFGTYTIATHSDAVLGAMIVLKGLGMTKPDIPLVGPNLERMNVDSPAEFHGTPSPSPTP